MARKRYQFTEAKIKRFQREKRGLGVGPDYIPWFLVSDVPSKGRSHRPFCPKTMREHHLLSDNEFYSFLKFWWDDQVIDIREQFPLDRRETFEIAALCGVKHPVDPHTGTVLVVTTDFILTKLIDGEKIIEAVATKEASDLKNKRIQDKLEIERQYWMRRGVVWRIITDKQVKNRFTLNLQWILDGDQNNYRDKEMHVIDAVVTSMIIRKKMEAPYSPIIPTCSWIDAQCNYVPGTALAALRRLLAIKAILIDMSKIKIYEAPLSAFSFSRG